MSLFNWKKTLHIVRGLPGSTKSSFALKLVGGNSDQLVENDDYWFMNKLSVPVVEHNYPTGYIIHVNTGNNKGGIHGPYLNHVFKDDYEYKYEQQMTHLAANWCCAEAFRRLRIYDDVAVANTFILRKHIFGYVEQARGLGVRVKLYVPDVPWKDDVEECFRKNVHGVPLDIMLKMKANWEECTQAEIDVLLGEKS